MDVAEIIEQMKKKRDEIFIEHDYNDDVLDGMNMMINFLIKAEETLYNRV